ncbi:hypothetical protein [Pseudonocardia adelaidensis]|uniref:Uncharacterized protein n=1 Tax=Pseudonocardia adelaidensis TaxID=648754 RepID=A0ABP9P109_9PSEU
MAMTTGPEFGVRLGRALLRRWPTVVGLLAAVGVLLAGADRMTVGLIVAVATTCYLAAAALRRAWVSWVAIPGSVVAIVLGGSLGQPPMTTLAVVAGVLVVVGLMARASRQVLTAQTAALLAYGALVVTGLAIAPTAGLVVVAGTLVAHAAWDAVHLQRKAVVSASLAEFCIVLDVLVGAAALLVLLAGGGW